MSKPRKHHLVAQVYQRGFAKRKGRGFQVLVLDKGTGKSSLRSVRDTFAQRDWNAIEDAAGTKDFGIETLLADHVDGLAAPGLVAMRDGRFPLDRGDREAVAIFMSAQLVRGRMPRQTLTEFVAEVGHVMLRQAAFGYTDQQWLDATGEIPSEELRKQIAQSEEHVKIQPSNAMLLKTLLSSVDEIADLLYRRTWTLARFAERCLFTGEHPVVEINPSGKAIGSGVMTAERIYMPVSPAVALVLSHPWTKWPEKVVNGTSDLASRLNWAVLSHPANAEVLLHPDTTGHPLPSPALLATGQRWPWGNDPESEPPVFLDYLPSVRSQSRGSRPNQPPHGIALPSVGGA